MSTLQRKKIINLFTSDFEDFMTPEYVARMDLLRADGEKILETVMVISPKSLEQGRTRRYPLPFETDL